MPFPSTPREIYKTNSLEVVICQIRYPAILAISANSPAEFQDKIRADYPWYEEMSNSAGVPPFPVPKEIAEFIASAHFPQFAQFPEHHFSVENKTRSISLTQEFIAVAERQYGRWEDFRQEIQRAELALCQTYSPAFYNRVGLRYVNVLVRDKFGLPDTPWSELLNPCFIGMLGDRGLADDVQGLTVESLLRIPDVDQGEVSLRHGLAKVKADDQQVYFIDADFHTNRRIGKNDVFEALDRFNKWGGYLFRWAASETLRRALGPTEI